MEFELYWIELKYSESNLNLNWIKLKIAESNLNWNWIESIEIAQVIEIFLYGR